MSKSSVIDPLITPLINAMNNTSWLQTISSCEGHEDNYPYVAFYCRADKINLLTRIIDNIEHEFFPGVFFDCCLVHDSQVSGYQGQAPTGWLSLQLKFTFTEKNAAYLPTVKKIIFNSLTQSIHG